ncbi:MAG: hypothetical protein O2887_13245 [Bacteroidetes bacterium]|nr:hypothetical protein [Bacteroidota bacterium]
MLDRVNGTIRWAVYPVLFFILTEVRAQVLPPNDESSIFSQFHNVVKANKKLQFVGSGLNVDDGTATWQVFEAQMAPQYLIYRGRDANKNWLKKGLITFTPVVVLRMYNLESFPVRPPNFNPEFDFYYFLNNVGKAPENNRVFRYAELRIAHFSNGQQDPFFSPNTNDVDLKNGTFSTNYYQAGFTQSGYVNGKSVLLDSALLSFSIFYRNDWELKNSPLTIEENLRHRYALQRFNFIVQLRTKNISQGTYEYNVHKYNRHISYLFRLENEIHLGDMSLFPGDKKHRLGITFTAAMYPANWRMFGFFASFYHGRDYYNIRFHRVISFVQAGFTVDFDKFKPLNHRFAGM